MSTPAPVVGVDGWSKGWVSVMLTERRDGIGVAVESFVAFDALIEATLDAAVIAVDMPIGLPMTPGRDADAAARRALSPHGSRVFPTFPRHVLAAATHAEAVLRCGDGPKISRQSYALRQKIFEVDPHRGDRRIHEVHPELAFAAMTGAPMVSKQTWHGVMRRRHALAEAGIEIPSELGDAGRVPVVDILDAAAAAWTAARIAAGVALCLPPDPPLQDGVPVAIWV